MSRREIVPTHSAYLELKAERGGMQEGYRFLDEKRLILASEILALLRDFEATMQRWRLARRDALGALRAALGRHGLEELAVYPAAAFADCGVATDPRSVLGVRIDDLRDSGPDGVAEPEVGRGAPARTASATAAANQRPANQSPEAERCRTCFARLPPIAARLAVLNGNLERLRLEYLRTSRRARALEDVLLPELDDTLRAVDAALEELEREEAVRVRRVGR